MDRLTTKLVVVNLIKLHLITKCFQGDYYLININLLTSWSDYPLQHLKKFSIKICLKDIPAQTYTTQSVLISNKKTRGLTWPLEP